MANGPHVLFSIAKIQREEQGRRNYYSGFSVRGAYSSHVMRAWTVKPLRAQLAWDSGDGIAGEETGHLEPAGEPAGTVAWRQWMQERQDMFTYNLTIYDLPFMVAMTSQHTRRWGGV